MVVDRPARLAIVTIDGPSGGGKSTVSRRVAAKLGYTYLDTGAMYRAVAYACRQTGVTLDDEEAVAGILANLEIDLTPAADAESDVGVRLNGQEIGDALRTPEIGMLASAVSRQAAVRATLTALQRRLASAGGVVAEGRDMGTVVFPQAAWKFYLDASAEERAHRRADQLRQRGEPVDEGALLVQIQARDRDDSSRNLAPLKAATDAVHIDSTRLSIAEVVKRMLAVIASKPLSGSDR